jgi:hypothetical protein
MPLKKIFFSYSRQDGAEFSLKLAVDLKKRGFNVWIDQQDIRAGTEWDLEVEKALETCDCLLFVETEKSVVSNNVLDEVYYALGQNKKVIPLIVVDSKTPFRIQRIQHVDFTKDYHSGLQKLIQELQTADTNVFAETVQLISSHKNFLQKYKGWLIAAACLVAVIITAVWYNTASKTTLAGDIKTTADEEDTTQNGGNKNDSTVAVIETEKVRSAKKMVKSNQKDAAVTENKPGKQTGKASTIDMADLTGEWRLKDIDMKTRSSDGYVRIEAGENDRFNIKSALRFFYIKPNDTAYLSIFNAFVGCSNCALQKEMKLAVEDIAIGSQQYSILKHDQAGVGKAGDTVMDRGSNKSVRGTAVLQFVDNKTAIIKVSRADAVTLEGGLVLKPFVYSFTFMKLE